MKKRILSLFCVLALCLGLLPATASAAGGEMTQYTHYLALGDRTCAVYPSYHSTSSYVFPYPARIAKEKGYILTTSANTGETSESLLARLAEEETQIKKSTVVSVTIGNTDLLYALRDYLMETYNAAHDSTLTADEVLDKMGKVDTDFLADMQDASVGSGFVNSEIYKKTAAELEANLREILETIQGYNPDAYLMVFNLYNPYCKLAAEDGDPRITPYAAGIPDAYDNGATALNTIIAQVCSENNAIHLVDAYDACKYIVDDTAPAKSDFALRSNLKMRDSGTPSKFYSGVEAFYPHVDAAAVIGTKANELKDLPKSEGWPVESDYEHCPQADWPGIIMASTSHGWWDIDENNTNALHNMWGASMNNYQAAIARWNNTLNLMGEWLAPGNWSDGYDGPFLNQDRFWKTTEADGKKVLDFDSGSETAFEDYNVWLDEENAILHLQDAQLETDTTCLTTNAKISDIFGEENNTLTIQLTGSSSFRSTVGATITTDGHEGDLRFTGNGSLEVHNTSSVADSSIHMDGDLSIAAGAQVTVYAVSAGPKQTAVQAKNVTIEDGGTLAIDLAAGSKAQPFDTGTDGTVTVKDGGALKVTVGSGVQADLTMLGTDSNLSNSAFRVDGILTLPDGLTTESLSKIFSGSGIVMLDGRAYAIAADGSLTEPDEANVVSGNIEVTTGTPVTEEDNKGYTWGQDDETKNWVLTLKTSMVTGDISITQDCKGENFDPNDEDAVPDPSVVGEDIVVRLVADKPCTVYGKITCEPTVPYIGAPIRHTYLAGTLAISGAGLTADTVEYQYGAVQLSGVLDARSISAWRTRLLADADLTLSEGISLAVNGNNLTQILRNVKVEKEDEGDKVLSDYTAEEVKKLVMDRYTDAFTMADGALYSYTGTTGTPIQVNLNCNPLVVISTEEGEQAENTLRLTLSQADLENTIQIPYDLQSAASLVLSIDSTSEGANTVYAITLQSEGALELPVPNRPGSSGGGSSSSSDSTITDITQNPDGSVTTTETNETTGTVTETTKYPDGSEKVVETQEDGTVTTTTTDADGSKEVVETKKDGTVTTTTTDTAGNQTQVVQNPDGSSKTTVENTDGSGSVTVVDENGKVVSEAKLSQSAIAAAQEAGETVALPMPQVPVTTDRESASTVTVDLPAGDSVKVEIPVENVTAGTVAILVKEDGTEEVIKTSVTTDNGVAVTLSDGDTVKIVDNSKTFVDVPAAYWGAEAVDFAVSRELFAGTSETTFSPDTAMTRSMIVTVLARFEGVDTSTGDTWYEAGRQWAMENGISDGTNMDASLTREQLAAMLYRYAKEKGYDTTQGGMAIREYDDFEQISGYAVEAMTWAVNTGLISGTTTTTLDPQGEATRAQVASILMRFIEGME